MGTATKQRSGYSKTPIYVGIAMLAISAIIYLIVKAVGGSHCHGNPGCIILLPIQLLPALPLIYGISLFIAYFYQKHIANKKHYRDEDVYSLAFKIFIISGLVLAVVPWLLTLM